MMNGEEEGELAKDGGGVGGLCGGVTRVLRGRRGSEAVEERVGRGSPKLLGIVERRVRFVLYRALSGEARKHADCH